ncbi:hypothetical protein [Brevundimonas goettingensis]|uniref:Uncharacterized protein n=1 Tax=Brevundimonas goettingensis TaxID=2774190 RepID=A0A975BYC0_9CAUL|nr:hypothetical protein [Brevundimonas goettingensis]QTC89776.1 hypothetical protein IFJ75_10670 [Brevundimonas goettingensis]
MAESPTGTKRLDLIEVLTEAVGRMGEMARGAGPALALTALLALAGVLLRLPQGAGMLLSALTLVAGLAAFGATTRIGTAGDLEAARRAGLRPGGLQLGKPEARLAGATLLCALFMAIMLALLAMVALALFGGAGLNAEAVKARDWAAVGPAWKLVLLSGVTLVVLGAPVLFAVRLCLYAPATVGRGQMVSLTATGLTNRAILPLLAGLAACAVPGLIWLGLVAAGVLGGRAAGAVAILMLVAIQWPLTSAFLGAAYRRLETHELLGVWQ